MNRSIGFATRTIKELAIQSSDRCVEFVGGETGDDVLWSASPPVPGVDLKPATDTGPVEFGTEGHFSRQQWQRFQSNAEKAVGVLEDVEICFASLRRRGER